MAYNSSAIDAKEALNIFNQSVGIVNDMIQIQKEYTKYILDITDNWKGGGSEKEASLVSTIYAAYDMYNNMSMAIAYGMQLISSAKTAGNTLYKAYSGTNEDLFGQSV